MQSTIQIPISLSFRSRGSLRRTQDVCIVILVQLVIYLMVRFICHFKDLLNVGSKSISVMVSYLLKPSLKSYLVLSKKGVWNKTYWDSLFKNDLLLAKGHRPWGAQKPCRTLVLWWNPTKDGIFTHSPWMPSLWSHRLWHNSRSLRTRENTCSMHSQ